MKKLKFVVFLMVAMYLTVSCDDDDKVQENVGKGKPSVALWVITDPNTLSGVLVPGEKMFSGTVDPAATTNATRLGAARTAGTAFGNAIYNPSNPAGDQGIQKLIPTETAFKPSGFIAVGEGRFTYELVSETKGYYTDSKRSLTAIQTFNPTTMERTGEIDIAEAMAPLMTEEVKRTRLGSFMIESQGKLYTQVFFYNKDGNHVYDITYVAVFDTASDTFLGFATHDDYIWLGFERKNPNYVTKADNGDIYLAGVLGNPRDMPHSRCFRIKAGATDFDDTWELDYNDFVGEGSFCLGGPVVKGDKLYVRFKSTGMKADYSNVKEENVEAYEIDIQTKTATKIKGIPGSGATTFSVSGPVFIGGKVYFAVSNTKYQGYYTYDTATKKVEEAFSLSGGMASQLIAF